MGQRNDVFRVRQQDRGMGGRCLKDPRKGNGAVSGQTRAAARPADAHVRWSEVKYVVNNGQGDLKMNSSPLCLKLMVGIILSMLSPLTTAQAASFDCGKAASEVEKIICSNDELSRLDESLSKAYLQALNRPDIKMQTIESQRQWLKKERNACKNGECIKNAYETRIKELGFLSPKASKSQATEPHNKAIQTKTEHQHGSTTDADADITRSLTMTCDYTDYGTYQTESVSITQTKNDQGKSAAIKESRRSRDRKDHETFIVRPGRFAECTYPTGNSVRVKVGEENLSGVVIAFGDSSAAPGMCVEDPEVFMSLWVNERKIVSGLSFAGHCSEDRDSPTVSFNISGTGKDVSIRKCHTAGQGAGDLTPENDNIKKDATKPLSICVDFPDISKYPRDLVEYPPEGTKTLKGGDIEILYGSGPVCQAAADELKRDFYTFYDHAHQSKTKLARPNWSETSVELPKELGRCVESIFDFNNDGKLDRVFRCDIYSRYMLGSVLLVQPGRSSSKLTVSASPLDSTSIYLPFQMGKVRHNIRDYPPFSQENDDAGFSMKGRNEKDGVSFWGRYSTVSPFAYHGSSYIAVSSHTPVDTNDYVAVLKPLPDGTFQKIGLFRRVPENF